MTEKEEKESVDCIHKPIFWAVWCGLLANIFYVFAFTNLAQCSPTMLTLSIAIDVIILLIIAVAGMVAFNTIAIAAVPAVVIMALITINSLIVCPLPSLALCLTGATIGVGGAYLLINKFSLKSNGGEKVAGVVGLSFLLSLALGLMPAAHMALVWQLPKDQKVLQDMKIADNKETLVLSSSMGDADRFKNFFYLALANGKKIHFDKAQIREEKIARKFFSDNEKKVDVEKMLTIGFPDVDSASVKAIGVNYFAAPNLEYPVRYLRSN